MTTATSDYAAQLRAKHADKKWGSSKKVPDMARWCIADFGVESLVDFGCGKGLVTRTLTEMFPDVDVTGYDPAKPDTALPDEVDMVFSKDVLEHIEPDMLESVIADLFRRTRKVQYHLIACHKAVHFMPDGRNAHLIVETPDWWQRLFRSMGFRIVEENIIGEIRRPKGRDTIATTKYECVIDCR